MKNKGEYRKDRHSPMVILEGLEPSTFRLKVECYYQLSYSIKFNFAFFSLQCYYSTLYIKSVVICIIFFQKFLIIFLISQNNTNTFFKEPREEILMFIPLVRQKKRNSKYEKALIIKAFSLVILEGFEPSTCRL